MRRGVKGEYTLNLADVSVHLDNVTLLVPSFKFEKRKECNSDITANEIAGFFNHFTGTVLKNQEALVKEDKLDPEEISARLKAATSRMSVLEIPRVYL